MDQDANKACFSPSSRFSTSAFFPFRRFSITTHKKSFFLFSKRNSSAFLEALDSRRGVQSRENLLESTKEHVQPYNLFTLANITRTWPVALMRLPRTRITAL
jgi:hypothetical protein